jgi:imidazolonepropionase-like amidohydrolase
MKIHTNAKILVMLSLCIVRILCAGTVAFVHVAVLPMDGEHVWQDQTVIVAGERILAVGPATVVRVPADASVINGGGSFLIPGLCDMHVHFAIPAEDSKFEASNRVYALQLLANGITTVRNMRGFVELLEFRGRTESGDVIGPEVYTTGPGNNSTFDVAPYDRKLITEADAIRAVHIDKAAGFDAIKVYGGLSAIPYRALMAEARRASMPVYGHVPYAVGLTEVLEQRQASIEHLTGYLEALNEPDSSHVLGSNNILAVDSLHEYSEDRLRDVGTATRLAGVWNCPTLVFLAAFGERCEGLRVIDFTVQPDCKGPNVSHFARSAMRALHQNGARILAGTDAEGTYVAHGISLHEELENIVAAGYSPYEALEAATSGPAEFLNRQRDSGTITAGKLANLVLLRFNPLSDIRNTNQRVGIMIRGRWYRQQQLDNWLAQALTHTRQPRFSRTSWRLDTPFFR